MLMLSFFRFKYTIKYGEKYKGGCPIVPNHDNHNRSHVHTEFVLLIPEICTDYVQIMCP